MLLREIQSSSVLTKTKLPGADYVINPYVGCQVGCIYCYAAFMKRFTNHAEEWGKFLDVKINAPEVLEKELKKAKKGLVLLSSVTDAYQPVERKYQLTRKILELLLKHKFPVSILTKCVLVTRDIDLLRQFDYCDVGFSISSLNDADRLIFEPVSSSVEQKINALKLLHNAGIKTYAFIGPVLPKITNVSEIVSKINKFVDFVWIEAINFKAAYQNSLFHLLETKRPDIAAEYSVLERNYDKYLEPLAKEVEELKKKYGMEIKFLVH